MTRRDHLFTIVAEEAVEIAQRATKILRFGPQEVQPGRQPHETNVRRLMEEMADLVATFDMLDQEGHLDGLFSNHDPELEARFHSKKERIEHYLEYSSRQGTLS